MVDAGLGVDQAAARFLAQIAPDLRDVAAERFARHDLGSARAPAWPSGKPYCSATADRPETLGFLACVSYPELI